MDALWKLEDKWKLSTQESVAFLVCTCSLVIGVCVVAAFRRRAATRRKGLVGQDPCMDNDSAHDIEWSKPPGVGLTTSVKKVLTSSVRWSGASKWEPKRSTSHTERISPLLVVEGQLEGDFAWQSHSSDSPVWQRPILMGEKCQLPRFSGLILYDERGRPVHEHVENQFISSDQEKADAVGKTTLRDLL